MGKQILFHMLAPDCEQFLSFVRQHDPVIVVEKSGDSAQVVSVTNPCKPGQALCLWNQNLISSLERKYIPKSNRGPYYRVSDALPVFEFFLPRQEEWDGTAALTQGRVYASFDQPSEGLRRWFDAVARWIRKNFSKNPAPNLSGYVGPAALKWYEEGGLLLPMIRPPVNDQWRAFLQPQLARSNKAS